MSYPRVVLRSQRCLQALLVAYLKVAHHRMSRTVCPTLKSQLPVSDGQRLVRQSFIGPADC